MAKYHFTKKAVEDLANIWNYTFDNWSEKQADKYYSLLLKFCKALAENPSKGKFYPIISPNLLGFKCGEHIIFYHEITQNEIEIIRILHGMMDLKRKF